MNNVESALSLFSQDFSCSQAVFSTYSEKFGLKHEKALKIASVFGGGMSLAETCGSVTGAFMVIGLKYGRDRVEDSAAKEKTRELTKEFISQFRSRNGSIVCRELLKYDISTPEGRQYVLDNKLFQTVCPAFVKDAIEILDNIL